MASGQAQWPQGYCTGTMALWLIQRDNGIMVSAQALWPDGYSAHQWIEGSGFWEHCMLLWGKTLYTVPLSSQVYKGIPANLMLVITLR